MKITVKIPREIGEWIEYCKSNSFTIYRALYPVKFNEKLTERMIKDSPLSWAWQFAKELEL